MNKGKSRGGARKGAGRKKGVGISYEIQKHCNNFIIELLKDEAIKVKALKQTSLIFQEDEQDFLYIIKNGRYYKIGYSSNWSKRHKNYKTHLGVVDLVYLSKQQDSFSLEAYLHNLFQDKRVNGEWFDLSNEDLLKAISYCSSRIK